MDARAQGAEILVPGSVANLGPGLDTLAVAVQVYLRLRVRESRDDGRKRLRFEFLGQQLQGENYIERAFRYQARKYNAEFPSLEVEVVTEIPMQAGLGSSAAATVAGLRLYEAVFGPLPMKELLTAATELEGHPDNAAAALYGGLTGSCQMPDGSVLAVSSPWPDAVKFLVLTPDISLKTKESRKALPRRIARADAVFNLQRVVLLLQSIQISDFALLKEALRDRWHQPFRATLVPGLDKALALDHPDLLGVCLSGSGPSIVALAEKNLDEIEALLAASYAPLNIPFRIRILGAHQSTTRGAAQQAVSMF